MSKAKGIRTVRMSGLPVNSGHIQKYEEEWKEEFDRLHKEHGKDMLSLQEALVGLEARLKKKYDVEASWDFIKSQKEMKGRIEEYGPIATVVDKETGKLTYIIIDQAL